MGYKTLVAVEGVDESLADKLFAADILNAPALAAADIETIMAAAKVDEERAEELKDQAATIAASGLLEELQKEEAVAEEMSSTANAKDTAAADAASEESVEKPGE